MVIVHMQSLLEERNVAVIWIHLHANNGLQNERYLAFLTTIWHEHNDDEDDYGRKIS